MTGHTAPEAFRPETLRVQADGALGTLTLARPQRLNALSRRSLQELIDAAAWFDACPDVRVVLVQAEGRAFCAGFDLQAFRAAEPGDDAGSDVDLGRQMVEAIEGLSALTVCALQGHVVGGGVLLAAACDLRCAARDARFLIPEVDVGIPLAWGGIPRLVRELGPALTRDLVLTCRPFDAAEALAANFLNRVFEPDALAAGALALAQSLADRPALLLQTTKRQVARASEDLVGTAGAVGDAALLLQARADPECRAAAAGYLARRAPRG